MVVRPFDGGEDRGLHGRPVVDHLGVVEAERLDAQARGRRIPSQIAMPLRCTFMILSPVDLQDQPLLDEEVDPPDSREHDLACQKQAEEVQAETYQ